MRSRTRIQFHHSLQSVSSSTMLQYRRKCKTHEFLFLSFLCSYNGERKGKWSRPHIHVINLKKEENIFTPAQRKKNAQLCPLLLLPVARHQTTARPRRVDEIKIIPNRKKKKKKKKAYSGERGEQHVVGCAQSTQQRWVLVLYNVGVYSTTRSCAGLNIGP